MGADARRVFVTGAYGLLGTWLVRALLDRGDEVTVLRHDGPAASALALEGLEANCVTVTGDVRDAEAVERALREHAPDTVFHLAAQSLLGPARRSPVPTFEANVRGTWMLLDSCRRLEIARVVVAGSYKAYGAQDRLPYTEDLPLAGRFPYEVSKAATDVIARSYFHTYGLPVAVTRFANVYGGGDLNFSRLVPEAAAAAIQGRRPVIRSDGTPERDFLYVADAVDAYLAIAAALEGGAAGEAFNAGGGRPHSVRDVVELVCRAAGTDAQPDIQGQGTPEGEIDRQYVDSTKLRELTGWSPQVELADGLRRTVEWYRRHQELLP